MKKTLNFFILIVIILSLNSCATIFSGTKANVKVNGTPKEAKVYANGNYEGMAPCKVKVSKNALKNGVTIRVEADGYEPQETLVTRKLKMGSFIFDLFIFPGGHIIDYVTGAVYKPFPNDVEFNLNAKSK